jgi:hypothetical protein
MYCAYFLQVIHAANLKCRTEDGNIRKLRQFIFLGGEFTEARNLSHSTAASQSRNHIQAHMFHITDGRQRERAFFNSFFQYPVCILY